MPLMPLKDNSFVALNTHPSSICYLEKIDDLKRFVVIKANNETLKVLHVSPFYENEEDAVFITYCALCLGYTFKKNIGKNIGGAIGNDMSKLNERKVLISRNILICNDISSLLTHRSLGQFYDKAIELATKIVCEDGDAQIKKKLTDNNTPIAGEWVLESYMPLDNYPLRDEEGYQQKDIGFLREGILPDLTHRDFYVALFDNANGDFKMVKTYQDTGYNQLSMEDTWGSLFKNDIIEGNLGFLYLFKNKKAYVRNFNYPFKELTYKIAKNLQSQFTLKNDKFYEYEIWQELPQIDNKPKQCIRKDIF